MHGANRQLGRGAARVTRGLTASTACALIPTVGHAAAAGGVLVDAGYIGAVVLLSIACVALADRRRNAVEIIAILMLTQPAFHVLLVMGSHHHDALSPSLSMALAHVVAAFVIGVMLSGAESTMWAMAALSATFLPSGLRRLMQKPLAAPTPTIRPLWNRQHRITPRATHVLLCAPLRGP